MNSVLALANLLAAATLLAWPVGLFMVVFLFDAPESASSAVTYLLACSIVAYPVPVVLGNLAYWRRRKRASTVRLCLFTAVTLSGTVPVFVANLVLDRLCGGTFDCAP